MNENLRKRCWLRILLGVLLGVQPTLLAGSCHCSASEEAACQCGNGCQQACCCRGPQAVTSKSCCDGETHCSQTTDIPGYDACTCGTAPEQNPVVPSNTTSEMSRVELPTFVLLPEAIEPTLSVNQELEIARLARMNGLPGGNQRQSLLRVWRK